MQKNPSYKVTQVKKLFDMLKARKDEFKTLGFDIANELDKDKIIKAYHKLAFEYCPDEQNQNAIKAE